jgi:hypothetical protein
LLTDTRLLTRCLLVLVVAAHSVAAAPASHPHAAAAYRTWETAAATALIARADANSLAAAAALRYMDPIQKPSALELAARASELAPDDASIGWLHLRLCGDTPTCDFRDVATVQRWVDADNGAAWLQNLAAARKDRDETEVDRILSDMAQGTRFDFYWNRIVVLMVDALYAARDDLPGGVAASDAARLKFASGIADTEIIPSFSALLEACRESSAIPGRRDPCLKLSKTMQRGDTVIAQITGFNIERRLHAPDSKEARAVAQRRHVLEWRVAAAARMDSPLLPWTKNARARARLAQMRALPREEDVCIAILRKYKMALDPPEVHP